jgi:hypothetical protein
MARNSKKIEENLTKSDVSKEIKVYMDTKTFNDKIEKIIKDRIKNEKDLEDKVVEITKNVLTQLYKTLWVRRGMWRDTLSNKSV